MNNEIREFNFNSKKIQTIMIKGEPWFTAKEITDLLEYKNGRDALRRHVRENCKGVVKHDTLGGTQNVTIINEAGLYTLIMKSKSKNAEPFQIWISEDLLPTLRKMGTYTIGNSQPTLPQSYLEALESLIVKVRENEMLAVQNIELVDSIETMQPKVSYCDSILATEDTITITQIAKDYGMAGNKMNKLLNELNVQYYQSGQWLLYSKYQEEGYTQSYTFKYLGYDKKMHSTVNTKWTQKGRLFLYNILRENDIYPLIEQ